MHVRCHLLLACYMQPCRANRTHRFWDQQIFSATLDAAVIRQSPGAQLIIQGSRSHELLDYPTRQDQLALVDAGHLVQAVGQLLSCPPCAITTL